MAAGGATVLVAGLFGAIDATASANFALTRIAGADRFETASKLATDAFSGAAATAVVARGDQFADALAGAYLAGSVNGPILLTQTDAVPKTTKDTLAALGAKTVYVLGGTGAVSTAAENDLKSSGYAVTRIQGADRYETGANVATTPSSAGIGQVGGQRTAFLVSGDNFADALAAGPVAAAGGFPILLTQANTLPPATRTAITTLGIKRIVTVGGTLAIADSASQAAATAAGSGVTSERIAGNDRTETSTKVADWAATNVASWSTTLVDLATGDNFADALAGGPAAGKTKRPILLTSTPALSQATSDWLNLHSTTLTGGRALGGTAALSAATLDAANGAGRGTGLKATGPVVAFDTTAKTYTYVPEGASESRKVTYKTGDTFSLNGASATMAAFEGALSQGDNVTNTPATASAVAKHDLVDVAPSSITSGTVGNIDGVQNQLDFIHPLSGDAIRPDVNFAAATGATAFTYTVDGAAVADVTAFKAHLSEGDTLVITGGNTFALTNKTVTGSANSITATANAGNNTVTFKIGGFGDDPSAGASPLAPTADSHFVANEGTALQAGDTFQVGGAASSYSAFAGAISDGDQVSYSLSGGKETFNLIANQAPAPVTGTIVSINKDGSGVPVVDDNADGGIVTIRTGSGDVPVKYTSGATFRVDGATATEAQFEAAATPGDTVTIQPGDTGTNTTERADLTNG
jgi:putative cell wall-binding protein